MRLKMNNYLVMLDEFRQRVSIASEQPVQLNRMLLFYEQ